jgi:hypothetical protein
MPTKPAAYARNGVLTTDLIDFTPALKEAGLAARVEQENADAVARAEGIVAPERPDFFNAMYAEIPQDLAVQRDTMHTHSLGQDPSQLPPEAQQRAAELAAEAAAAAHH